MEFSDYLVRVRNNDPALTRLDLQNRVLSLNDVKELSEGLKYNTHLKYLNVSDNAMGAEGAFYIAQALEKNSTLEYLNISWNDIGVTGMKHIIHALDHNRTLLYVVSGYNEVGYGEDALVEELRQRLERNKQLRNERIRYP